jgi:acetate kinase
MTTRSGSVDPGAVIYVLREHGLDPEALDHALNLDSGLKGLAGGSGSMVELESRAGSGDRQAELALRVFAHRLAAAVAAMAASCCGLDAIAFTAGIGENSSLVRERICERLRFLGVVLDQGRNAEAEPDCDIATDDSRSRVFVVRAREEIIAAREARALLASSPGADTA